MSTRAEQLERAAQARDEGIATAENAADPRVALAIDAAIERANKRGRRWSANDIRDQFPVANQGLVGARVRAAAQRRPAEMVAVGRTPSTLESTHHHEIKVWLGIDAWRAAHPSASQEVSR